MKKYFALSLYLGFFLSHSCFAQIEVNRQEGSLTWTVVDQLKVSPKQILKLPRSYDSHSTYQGLLGMGWCSLLEWSLVIIKDSMLLMTCDRPMVLTSNQVTRTGGGAEVKVGGLLLLFSSRGDLDGVEQKGQRWLLAKDLTGQVIGLHSGQGSVQFSFRKGLLSEARTGPQKISYIYQNVQLQKVESNSREFYQYDSFNNLKVIEFNRKKIKLDYDDLKDLLLKVTEDRCQTNYSYRSEQTSGLVQDEVLEKKTCPKSRAVRYHFQYTKSKNEIQLERTSVVNEGD